MSRLKEALEIIGKTTREKPISARGFAKIFWPNSDIHRKHSTGGTGSQAGKAAWLCAGSYFGKLYKKQYIGRVFEPSNGYYITQAGKDKLKELQDA